MINFKAHDEVQIDEFIQVLERSTLGKRRPTDDRQRMEDMIHHANLIVTARTQEGTLVGISRALTDFSYCTYLSCLAVDQEWQKQGIGRRLLDLTHETAGCHTNLLLLAAPAAESYYPHIGMEQHQSAWMIRGQNQDGYPAENC